jgi:hypothetical protein
MCWRNVDSNALLREAFGRKAVDPSAAPVDAAADAECDRHDRLVSIVTSIGSFPALTSRHIATVRRRAATHVLHSGGGGTKQPKRRRVVLHVFARLHHGRAGRRDLG